jgi:LacI family transcriptional regulator
MRGEGRISPEMRAKVLAAAKAAGYTLNPLAARLMSEMRRSRGNLFRGLLAAIDIAESHKDRNDSFIREIVGGARERAQALGFKIEQFFVGPQDLSFARLDTILQSRGITGVLLLPTWQPPDFSEIDWTRYAGIYTDRNGCNPALHVVCSDHYSSMIKLLRELHARGYRRPGLVTETWRDERLQGRRQASFHAFQHSGIDLDAIPPHLVNKVERHAFCDWFRQWQPDVVLAHFPEMIGWMESCGARVPETHGYVSLNTAYQKSGFAGLDQQPREIGTRAIEQLVAQIQRNERGVPAWPTTTTILSRWIEGPTLRSAQPSKPTRSVASR